MAKINIRNIALVLGVTLFDVGIGLYDRIINGIGIIRGLADIITPSSWFAFQIQASMPSTDIQISMVNTVTSTGTAFNFIALGIFVLAAAFIIAVISSTLGAAGKE